MNGSDTENFIRGDDQQGGYLATRYMLELGHRYFLHFKYPYENSFEVKARMNGICAALQEWRLPVETHLITFPHVWLWNAPATAPHSIEELSGTLPNDAEAEEFIAFLRKNPQITAIFGVNDANALHAWRALHHAGYRVPDDYSLVGFDDTDSLLGETRHNLLSSIRVPLLDIGCEAAHMAVRLVQSQVSEPTTQIMPVEFIPRASIGPVRTG
jgi:DNA-binding LacI/PurR family transcriptional regulator